MPNAEKDQNKKGEMMYEKQIKKSSCNVIKCRYDFK